MTQPLGPIEEPIDENVTGPDSPEFFVMTKEEPVTTSHKSTDFEFRNGKLYQRVVTVTANRVASSTSEDWVAVPGQ